MESSAGVDGRRVKLMLWVGAALVTAGAAAMYWPAALVVAGVLVMRLAAAAEATAAARHRAARAERNTPPRPELRT